jgi:hypothetical protein
MIRLISEMSGDHFKSRRFDITFPTEHGADGMGWALDALCERAEEECECSARQVPTGVMEQINRRRRQQATCADRFRILYYAIPLASHEARKAGAGCDGAGLGSRRTATAASPPDPTPTTL